jgi:nitroreductase
MDVFEAIDKRRSIRKFKPKPVAKADLEKILEAGRLAPSASNRQPWRFAIVRNPKVKENLSVAASNQSFIAEADVVIVALGDPNVYLKPSSSSAAILHRQDPAIALEHMVLAATALGYGTCWIGAFNEKEVKEILKIPEDLTVVALLPLGVPHQNPSPRPRKAFGEIFFKEAFGVPLEL